MIDLSYKIRDCLNIAFNLVLELIWEFLNYKKSTLNHFCTDKIKKIRDKVTSAKNSYDNKNYSNRFQIYI